MRAALMVLGVLWLGCSVQLSPVPCLDDLQCLPSQHCGLEAVCVDGARTAQMLGDSCKLAIRTVAAHASTCLGGSVEDFVRLLGPDEVCTSVEASVAAGRQVFRPEAFGSCVRKLLEKPCLELGRDGEETLEGNERTLEALAQGTLLEQCPAFEPLVPVGGTCASTADCQDGWCDASKTCPGVCRAFIPVSQECNNESRCQKDSSCALGRCVRDAGRGERCGLGVRCSSESDSSCEIPLCVERKRAGTCTKDTQCSLGYRCVKTQPLQGDDSPKECRAVKAIGDACEPGAGDCGLLSYCDPTSRTCRRSPGPLEPCGKIPGVGEYVDCLESRCDGSVCQEPALTEEVCGESRDCGPSRACWKGHCINQWCGG